MSNRILLVGNGGYGNRGCEAIHCGTRLILEEAFGTDVNVSAGIYASNEMVAKQNNNGSENHKTEFFALVNEGRRFSRNWLEHRLNKYLGCDFSGVHRPIANHLKDSVVALEIGGDNYSYDYGRPQHFLEMDNFLKRRGVPVVIWGASVGPFIGDSDYSNIMFDHLRSLDGIFVRESLSQKYLSENGVSKNVQLMADPAFLLPSECPDINSLGFELPNGAIGVNLSPLMAKFHSKKNIQVWELTTKDIEAWAGHCALCISELYKKTNRAIVLVPHVMSDHKYSDDYSFLKDVYFKLKADTDIGGDLYCLSSPLDAIQTKGLISKFDLFAGARTHSTIAALSSKVPTLSIGYSLKAQGINQDLFGSDKYVMNVSKFEPGSFSEKMAEMLDEVSEIKSKLRVSVPVMQERAMSAGRILRNLIDINREKLPES